VAPRLPLVGDVEDLPVGKKLPHPDEPGLPAAKDLLFEIPRQGVHHGESPDPASRTGHGIDDIVIAVPAQTRVPEGKARGPALVDAVGFHHLKKVLGNGPFVDLPGAEQFEIWFFFCDLFPVFHHIRRIQVNMAVNNHGNSSMDGILPAL